MFAFHLLLSPTGHMKRLNYVLLSGFIGAMNFGLLILVGLQSGAEIIEIIEGGPLFLAKAAPIPAAICALGMWVQICFVFKRSRDFSGSTLTGWLFVGLWAAPYLAPQLMVGADAAASFGSAKFASAIPAAIVGMILFFAGSREDSSAEAAHARKTEDGANYGRNDEYGLERLDETTDLVARAAALRAVEALPMAAADTVAVPPTSTAVQGFGKRKTFAGRARQ
ncbi:MAG: hypothetical protein GKR97_03855 [Rhizobiaceae bacterium]|nr:hypothetical protein [Rhizobiaceae bacterium]